MEQGAPPPQYGGRRRGAVSAEAHRGVAVVAVEAEKIPKSKEVYAQLEKVLAKNILFAHLDNKERHELFDFMKRVDGVADEVIIKQGDDGEAANHMYVVIEGELDVLKDYADGKGPIKVFHYGPGGVFGELALMYNTPRAATVVAKTPVVLYSIARQTFHSLLESETRKKRKIYAEFLSSVSLLSNLDSYERLRIADALTTESYSDGTVIVREGDEGDRFYLILEGQVKISKAGVEQKNSPLEAWQYFGELALLSDDKRQATCTAVGEVKCAWMDKESFTALMGPVRDILERNQANYIAAVPASVDPSRRPLRRGGVSAESSERLLAALEWRPAVRKKSPSSISTLESTLGKSFLLKGLTVAERAQLFDTMVPERFSEGDYVIRQGDTNGDKMFVVFHGELDVFKDNFDGNGPVKVFHYTDGDLFGELALMYETPRAASVVCCTNVKAWSIDRMTFRTLLMNGAKRRRELYQEFLSSVPLLQNLDRYERLKVADALTAETFGDGDVIIREGDEGNKFYLILEGQVKVEKGGVETHNSPLEPWQYFGELALLADDKRKATCTAIGHVVLASMDRPSFDSLLGPIRDILSRNREAYDPVSVASNAVPQQLARRCVRKNAVSSEADAEEADDLIGQSAVAERSEAELELLERSLGGSHMLSSMDVHGRRQVYNSMKRERYHAGTKVITQGDLVADKFFVVISGELVVIKDDQRVSSYETGGVFGELALMYNTPRAASVVTVSDSELWAIDRETFRSVLMKESKKRREMYQDFLSHVPLLSNLDKYERLKIADSLVTEYFDDGQVIVQEGQKGNRFYLVIEGSIRVTKNGVPTHNSPLKPGQYFGELALLHEDVRQATCTAIGSVRVVYMERKSFDRLLGPVKDVMERSTSGYLASRAVTDEDPLAPSKASN